MLDNSLLLYKKAAAGGAAPILAMDFEGSYADLATPSRVVSTVGGSPTISTSRFKNGTRSVQFGQEQGVCLSIPPADLVLAGDLTIEGWIWQSGPGNTGNTGGNQFLIGLNQIDTQAGIGVGLANSKLAFISIPKFGTNATFVSGVTTVTTGGWNHVAYTRSGSTIGVWLNGALDNTGTWTGSFSSTTAFYIGNYYDRRIGSTLGYAGLNGNLDRFRIYNYCKYTANFTPSVGAYPN